jgi:hypothetical protein
MEEYMLKNTCKNIPNASTIEAIKEGKKIMEDPTSPRYSSMEELKRALEI